MLKLFFLDGQLVDCHVLTADVDADLGLVTCERLVFDQAAKLKSLARSGAGGSPRSSHRQYSLCSRRWRGDTEKNVRATRYSVFTTRGVLDIR